MLDSFEILTTSGVVLWQKSYAPVGPNVINSLIKNVFIEESVAPVSDASASQNPPYKTDKYTLKWTTVKDLGLIFVAVYQSLLHLSWIDKLLDNVKTLFTSLYRDEFKKPHTSQVQCPFDDYFARQIQALEKSAGAVTAQNGNGMSSAGVSTPATELTPPSSAGEDAEDAPPPLPGLRAPQNDRTRLAAEDVESTHTSTDATPIPTPDSSRPATPSSHLVTGKAGPGGKTSRKARRMAATSAPQSRDQSSSAMKNKALPTGGKQMRRWDDSGAMDEGGNETLDYSSSAIAPNVENPAGEVPPETITQDSWARKTGKGEVVLKDLDDEMAAVLSSTNSSSTPSTAAGGIASTAYSAISGLFRNVVGGKQLSVADLQKPLQQMRDALIRKNVEREAAERLCTSVQSDLLDTKTGSFQSVDTAIAGSMEKSLTKIMTPTSSLDLLRSISAVRSTKGSGRRPYVISVVGVNGVGKSTTLAKLAFLLLHNNLRVLVVGADTFRSGAVEQLRVHVRNLQQLVRSSSTAETPLGDIDLYERGYGKDPAHIARDAIVHAASGTTEGFDVVLIDTAGRRHNDSRLMSSLEGFGRLANPDKIFMVGEALVGSDAVAQARDFNAAFGPKRGLDGFIVSKCDTVGEMVGTIVSMVHATGVPVVAVGVGQHYGDLRTLNVGWATRLLMS